MRKVAPHVLDVRTIIALCILLSTTLGTLMLLAGRAWPAPLDRYVRQWGLAMIGSGAAWLLFALRDVLTPVATLAVAHALLIAATLGLVRAIRGLFGQRVNRWSDVAIIGLPVAVSSWFTWIDPSLSARIVSLTLGVGVASVAGIVALLRYAPRPHQAGVITTLGCFALMATLLGARAFAELVAPVATVDFYSPAPLHALTFALGVFAPVIATVGFVMMAHDQVRRELDHLASRDPLTGMLNRRSLEQLAEHILANAAHRRQSAALLLVDADHFKRINDSMGHAAGDEALRSLSDSLLKSARRGDLIGRLGGEEFLMVLPDTDAASAAAAAERVRLEVCAHDLALGDQRVHLEVSIGVAMSGVGDDFASVLRRADQALYAAKRAGRNRVAVANIDAAVTVLTPPKAGDRRGGVESRADGAHASARLQ